MKTFSSIYPFTNRLELRRATCITSGAEGGGGGVWAKETDADRERHLQWRLHQWFFIRPRMDFATQALDALDKFESGLGGWEQEEIAKEKERREKNPPVPGKFYAPDMEEKLLRKAHRVVLPLNARYTALVSAVAGMEWLVTLLLKECRQEAAKFVQEQAKKAGVETACGFKSARAIIHSARLGWGGAAETLKIFAKGGDIEDKKSSLKEFHDLCVVRNAIVHCGGRVKDVRDRDRDRFLAAADRLNFRVLTEVEIDGEKFDMPLADADGWKATSGQLWIERDALRKPVKRTLDFIHEVHKAYLD